MAHLGPQGTLRPQGLQCMQLADGTVEPASGTVFAAAGSWEALGMAPCDHVQGRQLGMAPCDHRADTGMAHLGSQACSACSWQTQLWSPHRVQCARVLVAGRDRALGTGQSWGAPRRHAGHCALYVHCGARIGYSVEGGLADATVEPASGTVCESAGGRARPCPRDWPVLGSPTAACGALCPLRALWSPHRVQC